MRDLTWGNVAPRPANAQSAAVPGYECTFCIDDLAAVRRLAAGHGLAAGLSPSRLSDFILAVNEVATNAICHGCDRARLRLWRSGDQVCCQVHGGRWISREQPPAVVDDAEGLRLWVVGQLCSTVAFSYGPDDTTVLVSMPIN
jgi:serine/threonine-protein kinase RsbW